MRAVAVAHATITPHASRGYRRISYRLRDAEHAGPLRCRSVGGGAALRKRRINAFQCTTPTRRATSSHQLPSVFARFKGEEIDRAKCGFEVGRLADLDGRLRLPQHSADVR